MGNFCLSGVAIAKAGANMAAQLSGANLQRVSGANTQAVVDLYIDQAESVINAATRKNWSDVFNDLDTDVRQILEDTASDLAAIKLINFDMGGYTSRGEAESMITVLRDNALRNIAILRDKKTEEFMT